METSTIKFEVSYSLVITPAMMASGEIGVVYVGPEGVKQETYAPFDYHNHKFLNTSPVECNISLTDMVHL